VNSVRFENFKISQNLSFLYRPEYKLFRFGFCKTIEYIIVNIYDFFMDFFETSKCQISEISKTGSMEPVLQIDFLASAHHYTVCHALRARRIFDGAGPYTNYQVLCHTCSVYNTQLCFLHFPDTRNVQWSNRIIFFVFYLPNVSTCEAHTCYLSNLWLSATYVERHALHTCMSSGFGCVP
jgi:hypothetical protein